MPEKKKTTKKSEPKPETKPETKKEAPTSSQSLRNFGSASR